MRKFILLPLAFILLSAGCGAFRPLTSDLRPPTSDSSFILQPSSLSPVPFRSGTQARAVVCGLTNVNPPSYNGWAGACPGCDVDALTFAVACESNGVAYELLLNQRATANGVVEAARRACAGLKAGDLLILYLSGHGGQTQDAAGDEADGRDETLCLWDGQMTDDVVWSWLCKIPPGIRIWMVTDTCNSGTNYRGPHSYSRALSSRSLISDLRSPTSDLSLLHWGGCGDGQSSFGSAQGGRFTTALVDAYVAGQSYDAWFETALRKMPPGQTPTRESVGAPFGHLPAFR